MKIRKLVGSGDTIMRLVLPFLVVGLTLNILFPSAFSVGGSPHLLKVISIIFMIPGIIIWLWSAALIVTRIPQNKLITSGPFSLVRHPLYTGVALLVLPWVGFFFNTWLGALIGIVMYIASRIYSPREEKLLSNNYGSAWDEYCRTVKIKWL